MLFVCKNQNNAVYLYHTIKNNNTMEAKEFNIGQIVKGKNCRFLVVEDIDTKLKCNTYARPEHPNGKYFGRNNCCDKCAFSKRVLTGYTSTVECSLSTQVKCYGELRSDKKNIIFRKI